MKMSLTRSSALSQLQKLPINPAMEFICSFYFPSQFWIYFYPLPPLFYFSSKCDLLFVLPLKWKQLPFPRILQAHLLHTIYYIASSSNYGGDCCTLAELYVTLKQKKLLGRPSKIQHRLDLLSVSVLKRAPLCFPQPICKYSRPHFNFSFALWIHSLKLMFGWIFPRFFLGS